MIYIVNKMLKQPMKLFYGSYCFQKAIIKKCFSLGIFKSSIKSWNVVFFGSDSFSLQSLHALTKNLDDLHIKNLEVVTVNKRNPIYQYAVSQHLKTHLWPPVLNGLHDFGVIVSFGKFIPKKILNQFSLGIINVHASLLPRWRGGMPIVHTIKNGETVSGITVIRINCDKFDTGEVILMKPVSIGENELMPSVHKKLSKLGAKCLLEVINNMPKCLENVTPQSNENVSLAPILKKDSSIVKWSEMTAKEVYDLYRGLFGLYDIRTRFQGQPVKLMCLSLNGTIDNVRQNECPSAPSPGSIHYNKNNKYLVVQCREKTIKICSVIFKGKLYSANNFYRGFLALTPENLWRFDS